VVIFKKINPHIADLFFTSGLLQPPAHIAPNITFGCALQMKQN
jgi:hypothetical protein